MKNINAFLQYCRCPKISMHFINFPKLLMHLQYLCIFQYCTTTLPLNGPTLQELLNLAFFCQIVWGSILLFWIFKHHCLQNQNPIHVGVGPSLSFQTWIKPEPSPFEPEPSFEPNINAFLASGPSSRRAELWFVISLNWWRSSISPVIEIVFLDWTELDSGQIQQDFSSWPWDNENQVLCKKARKISRKILTSPLSLFVSDMIRVTDFSTYVM